VTALHFRAHWRTDANAGPSELVAWRHLHDIDGFLPPAMRIAMPAGSTEQAAAWAMLAPDPDGWTARLRAAVAQSIDWRISQANELVLGIVQLCSPDEAHRFLASPPELVRELSGIKASHSWHFAQFIRQVVGCLAPAGSWRDRALRCLVKHRINPGRKI
jgi:hypothetical protein